MSEKKINYEKSMARLEKIVNELESKDVPLDQAIQKFEEGLNLVNELNKELTTFNEKLEKMIKDHKVDVDE